VAQVQSTCKLCPKPCNASQALQANCSRPCNNIVLPPGRQQESIVHLTALRPHTHASPEGLEERIGASSLACNDNGQGTPKEALNRSHACQEKASSAGRHSSLSGLDFVTCRGNPRHGGFTHACIPWNSQSATQHHQCRTVRCSYMHEHHTTGTSRGVRAQGLLLLSPKHLHCCAAYVVLNVQVPVV
jgi:hypothetical protein